jgi:hypothetical protein
MKNKYRVDITLTHSGGVIQNYLFIEVFNDSAEAIQQAMEMVKSQFPQEYMESRDFEIKAKHVGFSPA